MIARHDAPAGRETGSGRVDVQRRWAAVGPLGGAIDGNDQVWVSTLIGTRLVRLCGANTETCPAGMKTGDAISPPGGYVAGGMQWLTDVAIDPAGDVWVANNWQSSDRSSAHPAHPDALDQVGAVYEQQRGRCVRAVVKSVFRGLSANKMRSDPTDALHDAPTSDRSHHDVAPWLVDPPVVAGGGNGVRVGKQHWV